MANRRMFSKSITNSSKFIRMPASSRLLYYDLGMNADDDGFCEWYSVLQMTNMQHQDLQVLQANNFIRIFDDNVLVIRDWKENNYIQKDRYSPSKHIETYKNELLEMGWTPERLRIEQPTDRPKAENGQPTEKQIASKMDTICIHNGYIPVQNPCIQDVYSMDTQVRLGKVSTEEIPSSEKKSENTENGFAPASRMTPITASLPPRPNTAYKKKKPFYRGLEMRQAQNKWWVLPKDGGEWLEYADSESKIEWREV